VEPDQARRAEDERVVVEGRLRQAQFAAQLAEGGRLVIPVGTPDEQRLLRVVKHGDALTERELYHCRFVPLVGQYGWKPKGA